MSITASVAFRSALELKAMQQLIIDNLSRTADHAPFTVAPTHRVATWGFFDADQSPICDIEVTPSDLFEPLYGIRANYKVVVRTSRHNFQWDRRPFVLRLLHDLVVNRSVITEAVYTCDEPALIFKDGVFYANLMDYLWSTVLRYFVSSEIVSDDSLFMDDPHCYAYENWEGLVAYDSHLLDYQDERGHNLFDLAAIYGDKKSIEFLMRLDFSVEPTNPDGITPLLKACRMGWKDAVEVLLSLGVDINQRSATGESALIIATKSRHIRIVEMLLAAGANKYVRAPDGRTALHIAIDAKGDELIQLLAD